MNSWFYNWSQLKDSGITSLHLDIDRNMIQVHEATSTLTLYPEGYVNPKKVEFPSPNYPYNFVFNGSVGKVSEDDDVCYDAKINLVSYEKKLTATAIKVGKDLYTLLQHYHKVPSVPPKRDDSIFTRSDDYRAALLQHLKEINDASEFNNFREALVIKLNSYDDNTTSDSADSIKNKFAETSPIKDVSVESITPTQLLALKGKEKEFEFEFIKITRNICSHISDLINGELQEESNKEVSRRKILRFHVNLYCSLIKLEGYCALNTKFKQGQNQKKMAKRLIEKYCTNISKPKLDLMIKRASRMFLLLNLSKFDWRIMDCFEELTASFFISAMKVTGNFFIWLNLVKSGVLVGYDQANLFHTNGKEELKQAKLAFLQNDFGELDGVNLNELVFDDDLEANI